MRPNRYRGLACNSHARMTTPRSAVMRCVIHKRGGWRFPTRPDVRRSRFCTATETTRAAPCPLKLLSRPLKASGRRERRKHRRRVSGLSASGPRGLLVASDPAAGRGARRSVTSRHGKKKIKKTRGSSLQEIIRPSLLTGGSEQVFLLLIWFPPPRVVCGRR